MRGSQRGGARHRWGTRTPPRVRPVLLELRRLQRQEIELLGAGGPRCRSRGGESWGELLELAGDDLDGRADAAPLTGVAGGIPAAAGLQREPGRGVEAQVLFIGVLDEIGPAAAAERRGGLRDEEHPVARELRGDR